MDQVLTTIKDVTPKQHGTRDESEILALCRAASAWILGELGAFMPYTETRRFDGNGRVDLFIPPLLSTAPTIVDDGDTLTATDYILYGSGPKTPRWRSGPFTRVTIDPDATTLSVWTNEEDVITISGKWGLYDESISLAATVQNDPYNGTSLILSRGDEISPGAVLLIGTENILVTATGSATDVGKNLSGAIDANQETITLEASHGLFRGEVIRIGTEDMLILTVATNDFSVVRGYNGTPRAAHADAADVYVYRTFTTTRAVNGTTSADHAQGTSISQQIPPWDVAYLARQIAVLMLKKAESGFAGKVGNADLGEVFYHNEFPKDVYERIKKNYKIVRL